jgi:c(7)-type cytochrome triheme protein
LTSRKVLIFVVMSLFVIGVAGLAIAVPPGKFLEWETPAGKVKFDGGFHASKGLVCKDCHGDPKVFEMKKTTGKKMAEMNKGKFCGHCHNGKEKEIKDTKITVFSTADPKSCSRCHKK